MDGGTLSGTAEFSEEEVAELEKLQLNPVKENEILAKLILTREQVNIFYVTSRFLMAMGVYLQCNFCIF